MADKAPGLEFSNYWTQFVQPPSASEGGGVLGNWLAGVLGGLKNPEDKKESSLETKPSLPGNIQSYSPATNFPEVFNQQYDSPYAPAYTSSQPVVPPQSPTSLQGFVKPPQYGVPPTQPNYLEQAQNQVKLNKMMQPDGTIGSAQNNDVSPVQPNYLQQAQNQVTLNNRMQPNGELGPVQNNGYLPITNQIWKK